MASRHGSGGRSGGWWRGRLRRLPRPSWSRRKTIVVLGLAAVLLGIRIAAPHVLKSAINERLHRIPDYQGHVQDVDLHLWRGAYALDGVEIWKEYGELSMPLFTARRIDFSIAWRELFRGQIVSEIDADVASLTLVKGYSEVSSQMDTDRRWQEVIQDLFPIEITHLEVKRGDLHYLDKTQSPEVYLSASEVHLVATGLRNRSSGMDEGNLPAAINLNARTAGDGTLQLSMRAAPLAPQPLFDLDVAIEHVSLPALNDLLRAYANVDVSRGVFEIYMEVAASRGAFRGYVKPFFRDLDFENLSDRNRPLLGRVWESIVKLTNEVLQNPESGRLGTRVPFAGDFEGTEVGTWTGVVNAVRNGFGAAFSEAIEGRIRPEDVVAPKEP